LFCSLSARNIYFISGVLISHVLLLLFLARLLSFAIPTEPGILSVSLHAEGSNLSSRQKSLATPQKSSSSSKESQSPIQGGEDASQISAENAELAPLGKARKVIHSPKPHYPIVSRRLREQGLVVVRLCVNERGEVGEVGVSRTSGYQALDRSALTALSQWKFMPITLNDRRNGLDIESQCFQTPVQFSLEG